MGFLLYLGLTFCDDFCINYVLLILSYGDNYGHNWGTERHSRRA